MQKNLLANKNAEFLQFIKKQLALHDCNICADETCDSSVVLIALVALSRIWFQLLAFIYLA